MGGSSGSTKIVGRGERGELADRAMDDALNNPTFTGERNARLNNTQNQALAGIEQTAAAGNPNVDQALQLNQDTLSGAFLGPNPHLSAALDPIRQEFQRTVAPSIDAGAAGAGRLGSGAHAVQQDTAQQSLADAMGRVAYDNYSQERGRQQQALANAPALSQARYADDQHLLAAGGIRQEDAQNRIDDQVRQFYERKQAPLDLLQLHAGVPNVPGANPTAGALGGAATGAGLGAQVSGGNPYAVAAGAVIGGVGGYYGSR